MKNLAPIKKEKEKIRGKYIHKQIGVGQSDHHHSSRFELRRHIPEQTTGARLRLEAVVQRELTTHKIEEEVGRR
jgi:hypothetical protein